VGRVRERGWDKGGPITKEGHAKEVTAVGGRVGRPRTLVPDAGSGGGPRNQAPHRLRALGPSNGGSNKSDYVFRR
jgi:hypothetical protein